MAGRRSLHAVVLFAVILHAIAISQTLLPAQDGLKFIRIAREFQTQPWDDVIRGSDAHPLYPALIAAVQPVVAWFTGPGPAAWRTAAQIVAVIASVGLILPIYGLTAMLFDRRIACMAAGARGTCCPRGRAGPRYAQRQPRPHVHVPRALAGRRGTAPRRLANRRRLAGFAAGAGYLARPEVILVPGAIALAWLVGFLRQPRPRHAIATFPRSVTLLCRALRRGWLLRVVKGEISEKLALRLTASLGPNHEHPRSPLRSSFRAGWMIPRWDFSPKEEGERIPIHGAANAVGRIVGKWWEELCWFFAVMTVWGLARERLHPRPLPRSRPGRLERDRAPAAC